MNKIPGMWIEAFTDGKEMIESLEERMTGRYAAEDIVDPETGEVLVKANHMITPKRAARVAKTGLTRVKIRTVLSCRSHIGVCARCYGANMATGQAVQVGEAVGIIAAQSIGEPGTQLTMRTFHTGGVAGDDITQGLPRVEELFEARKPKGLAIIAEFGGIATIKDTKKKREVIVTNNETGEAKAYLIPYGSRIKVTDGQVLEAGDELTEGSINPHDLLKIKGVRAVQDYMIREVQRVYRLQGVEINDKHVEVIVRQMLKKIRIESSGDTEYLPGTLLMFLTLMKSMRIFLKKVRHRQRVRRLCSVSQKHPWQQTPSYQRLPSRKQQRYLQEAAIKGKVDPLIGLKENVLIGKLIPAGTGMKRYRNIKLDTDEAFEEQMRAAREAELAEEYYKSLKEKGESHQEDEEDAVSDIDQIEDEESIDIIEDFDDLEE